MTAEGNDSVVHRMVIRHGQRDFQPVETSMDAEATQKWFSLLRLHVRVAHDNRPNKSLVYIRDGTRAAVLYRLSSPPSDNRNDVCHALVGDHSQLPSELALQLCEWDQWQHSEFWKEPLRPLSNGQLHKVLNMSKRLRQEAKEQHKELIDVVTAMLRPPAGPVSIVAGANSLLQRAGLLWGIRAVAEALFDVPGQQRFTFSTFEERSDLGAGYLPLVIFIPPGLGRDSSFPPRREVPDSSEPRVRPEEKKYFNTAAVLVAGYLGDEDWDAARWLAENSILEPPSIDERIERLVTVANAQDVLSLSRQSSREKTGQSSGSAESADAAAGQQQLDDRPAVPTVYARLSRPFSNVLHFLLPRKAKSTSESDEIRDLLRQLRSGQPESVTAAVDKIGQLGQPGQLEQRSDSDKKYIHKQLVKWRFFENELRVAFSPDEMHEAVKSLVRFGITAADLDDRPLVVRLHEMSKAADQPRLVTAELVNYAYENEQSEWFEQSTRWRARLGASLNRSAVRADYRREKHEREVENKFLRWIRIGVVPVTIVGVVWLIMTGSLLLANLFSNLTGAEAPPPVSTTTTGGPTTPDPATLPDSVALNRVIKGIGLYQVTRRSLIVTDSIDWKPRPQPTVKYDWPLQFSVSVEVTVFVNFADLPPVTPDSLDSGHRTAQLSHPRAKLDNLLIDQSSFHFTDLKDKGVIWNPEVGDLERLDDQIKSRIYDYAREIVTGSEQNAEALLRDLFKAYHYEVKFG
jgi:hypothetical protein